MANNNLGKEAGKRSFENLMFEEQLKAAGNTEDDTSPNDQGGSGCSGCLWFVFAIIAVAVIVLAIYYGIAAH